MISSADIANATAIQAVRTAEDQAVLIAWLIDRVSKLEAQLGVEPAPCPELPSARRQRLYLSAMQDDRAAFGLSRGLGR